MAMTRKMRNVVSLLLIFGLVANSAADKSFQVDQEDQVDPAAADIFVKPKPGFCTGCLSEVNKDDANVIELAKASLEQLNGGELVARPHQLLRVIKAQRQVINGIRYVLDVELSNDAEPKLLCTIEVIEAAVDRQRRVTSFDCPKEEVEVTTLSDVEEQVIPDDSTQTPASESMSSETMKVQEVQAGNHVEAQQERMRRANAMLGAPEPLDLQKEAETIRRLALIALDEIDDIEVDASQRKLINVVEASKQVVNGILYHLKMRVGMHPPPCNQGEADCISGQMPTLLCTVQVHEPTDAAGETVKAKVMRSECEPEGPFEVDEQGPDDSDRTQRSQAAAFAAKRVRREKKLLGAPAQADLNDQYIQEIAKFSVAELDKGSNALFHRTIVRLIEAKKQVVQGVLVHLTYELGYSDCRKGSTQNLEDCKLQDNTDREICEVKVWDQPWLKERSVTNFTCVNSYRRNKRSLIGKGSHDIHMGIFLKYMQRYEKKYDDETEFRRRFHIFRANMKKVQLLQESEQGTAKYGPTQFADMTTEEFKKHLGLNMEVANKRTMKAQQAVIPNVQLADEFDWRNYNAVTPVKNQGQCGSCWAFSVTGNVEGQWAIKKGQLLSLSEQELVDCDSLDNGCNGGLPSNAYESIINVGGLETESDYPYDGKDEKCHFDKTEAKVQLTGAVNITTDETDMAKWLTKNGPISIGINANAMQFYFGGVSHPLKFLCDPNNLDHGVLIVGYGVHTYPLFNKTLPYWVVKNSWGPTWGEQGYYRVYRGDGTCGVNLMATSALVD